MTRRQRARHFVWYQGKIMLRVISGSPARIGPPPERTDLLASPPPRPSPVPQEGRELSPYARLKQEMRDIDEVRDGLIRRGRRALEQRQYTLAEQQLRQAVQADALDESEACYYLAITRLWQRDFDEAWYLFEVDSQDREGEAPLSWLLAEWCALCASSSLEAYLTAVQDELEEREDPLAFKNEMFAMGYEEYDDVALQLLVSAFFAVLHGNATHCLDLLDLCESDILEIPSWCVSFWRGMALATLGRYEEAQAAVQQALIQEIPPLLLLPLRWFEHSHPGLYAPCVAPLFTTHALWKDVAARDEREQLVQRERQKRSQWRAAHDDEHLL